MLSAKPYQTPGFWWLWAFEHATVIYSHIMCNNVFVLNRLSLWIRNDKSGQNITRLKGDTFQGLLILDRGLGSKPSHVIILDLVSSWKHGSARSKCKQMAIQRGERGTNRIQVKRRVFRESALFHSTLLLWESWIQAFVPFVERIKW